MNFFNVGIVLVSININFDWALNYVLKIIGAFFMLMGVNETEMVSKGFIAARKGIIIIIAVSAGGLGFSLLSGAGVIKGAAAKIMSVIFGAGSAAAGLCSQYQIIVKLMLPRHELVNDPSLLNDVKNKWRTMAVYTCLCLVCDAANRFLPDGTVQAVFGAVLTIAKIIMLVYVLLLASSFNKARMDFNKMHPL